MVLNCDNNQIAKSQMQAYFPANSWKKKKKILKVWSTELRKRARPREREQEQRKNRGTDAHRDEMVPSPDEEYNRALSLRTWEEHCSLGGIRPLQQHIRALLRFGHLVVYYHRYSMRAQLKQQQQNKIQVHWKTNMVFQFLGHSKLLQQTSFRATAPVCSCALKPQKYNKLPFQKHEREPATRH